MIPIILYKNRCEKSSRPNEKEWRLFKFDESPKGKYDVLATDIKPVAIYLGSSISDEDRDTLLAICKDKKLIATK